MIMYKAAINHIIPVEIWNPDMDFKRFRKSNN